MKNYPKKINNKKKHYMLGKNDFDNILFGTVLLVAETGVPVENNKVREYLKKISLELLYCALVRGGVRT